MQISGKNVVITGASRGIGLALAEECAKKQARLFLVSRRFEAGTEEKLKNLGAPHVQLLSYDLSKTTQVNALHEKLTQDQIDIDVLINNAGLLTGGLLEDQNPDAIDEMLNVNVHALIRLTRLSLPAMLQRKKGCIVNNASVSGKMFFPCASTYAASKAAVVAFTESLKQELRNTGVNTVLMITPGVKTNMFDDISQLYGKNLDVSFLSHIPAEEWSQKVVSAIENQEDIVWPEGVSRWGVRLAHHVPGIFEKIVRSKFKRTL